MSRNTLLAFVLRVSILVAAPCLALPAQGKLWIVSDRPCPKVAFSEIQLAVDAAAEGDVILVRGRTDGLSYAGFTIDGKSLAIVADGILHLRIGDVAIRNLRGGQSVLLQGFQRFASFPQAHGAGLDLRSNNGVIWIENWLFRFQGIRRIQSCASVVFARCTLAGNTTTANIDRGLDVSWSEVSLYDSTVIGGTGSTGLYCSPGVVVFLSGSAVAGGTGYNGLSQFSFCTNGGPGGNGLYIGSGSQVFRLDSTITGGLGGFPGVAFFGGYTCYFGPPGTDITGPGTVVELAGAARSFESAAPILERETVPMTLTGESGDLAAVMLSAGQKHQFYPWLFGTLVTELPALAPLIGAIPPQGILNTSFVLSPGVVGPDRAAVVFTQGLFQDAAGRMRLGSPFAWVLLDEDHDPLDGCNPMRVIWVDDDAPNDPGPGNPLVSDPLENGSLEHPFDAIQEAVDDAIDGNTIRVRDGVYNGPGNEQIVIRDLAIILKSENGPQNCVLQAAAGATGIDAEEDVEIEGLTISGAKIGVLTSGAVAVRDCVITACSDAGLYLDGGAARPATIKRCVVDGNAGQGIDSDVSQAVVDACTITNNSDSGVRIQRGSYLTLRNSLIARNTAATGGGIFANGVFTIRGCTVVDNVATGLGSGLYVESVGVGAKEAYSSIFWGNAGLQIHVQGGGLRLDYSDIEGGLAGIGSLQVIYGSSNLNVDPLFVNATAGDYHLQPTSPCIDVGDPGYVPLPREADIDGEQRLQGAAVEMGADEVR